MLRYSVGDEAFFTILKNYLTKYRFGTAEIHDLRLVAEEVTGRDLNWFFNQWYFNTGHPDLVISHKLADNKRSITILVEQKQDTILHGAFTLPLTIELHTSGGLKRTNIVIDKTKQAFTIESNEIIYNSIFDADKILPANIEESKPFEMWYHQANNADLLINRKIALEELNNNISADTSEKMLDLTLSRLLTDTFYLNRQIALNVITDLTIRPSENVLGLTEKLAKTDWNAYNRSLAIDILGTYIKKEYETTFRNGLNDSSYRVMAKSLSYLYELDTTDALRFAKANESNNNSSVVWALANLYAEDISPSHYDFFKRITNIKDKHWPYTLKYFGDYLLKQQPELQLEAITYLNTQKRGNNYYSYLTSGFYKLLKTETEQNKAAVQELLKKNKKDETIKASLQGKILTYDNILKALAE
jgi:aminopeptidase N